MSLISSFKKLSLKEIPETAAKSPIFPESVYSNESLALNHQWIKLSGELPKYLDELNDNLRSFTYISGNQPSNADFIVFEKALSIAKTWVDADVAKYRHILRWADLVQNTLIEVEDKLVVNHDIELPKEIKEKKKPVEAKPEAKKEVKKEAPKETQPQQAKELSEEEKLKRAEAAKAKKAAKAKAKSDQQAATAATAVPPNPAMIDFRVGFIQKAIKHPDADALYVSTIDMGDEEGPRTVCSGLVKYVPIEEMQQRYIVVIANLKPVSMRGIKSSAMVLCASDEEKVEFVNPPAGSKAGDKLFFEDFNGTPEKQLNPKKKIWEAVQPGFSTNESLEVVFREEGKPEKRLVNEKGELCKNSSIVAANVR